MKGLVIRNPDGTFGVKGVDIKAVSPELYGVICKLKDYERSGLTPDEVTQLNEFEGSQIEKLLAGNTRLRAENDKYYYTLLGVMHSVDKWLEGDELKQDEVNRAAAMREKTLQIVEALQTELEHIKQEAIIKDRRKTDEDT